MNEQSATFADYVRETVEAQPQAPLWYADEGLAIYGDAEAVAAMFEAMARAQGNFMPITKNREVKVMKNGKLLYKYRYAELGTIIEATRPHLTAEGISVWQPPSRRSQTVGIQRTMISHKGGAFVVSSVLVTWGHEERQEDGSTRWVDDPKIVAGDLTYWQRYGYAKTLGLATDEDADDRPKDGDGEGASAESEDIGARLPNMKWLSGDAGKPIKDCSVAVLQKYSDWQAGKLDPTSDYYAANKQLLADIDAEIKRREQDRPAESVEKGDPMGLSGDPAAEVKALAAALPGDLAKGIGDAARELKLGAKGLDAFAQEHMGAKSYAAVLKVEEKARELLAKLHGEIARRAEDAAQQPRVES